MIDRPPLSLHSRPPSGKLNHSFRLAEPIGFPASYLSRPAYGATAFGPAISIAFRYAGRASMRFT